MKGCWVSTEVSCKQKPKQKTNKEKQNKNEQGILVTCNYLYLQAFSGNNGHSVVVQECATSRRS